MGAIKTQKAMREYECTKCDKKIAKGETYVKVSKKFARPWKTCMSCKPSQRDMVTSETIVMKMDIEDAVGQIAISEKDDIQMAIETLETAISDTEELQSMCEEKADNIEEYFPSGNPTSEMFRERAEACDEFISECENVKDDLENALSEWEDLDKEDREGKLEELSSDASCLCFNI